MCGQLCKMGLINSQLAKGRAISFSLSNIVCLAKKRRTNTQNLKDAYGHYFTEQKSCFAVIQSKETSLI